MNPKTNTSRKGAAGRIVAGKSWSAPRRLLDRALLGRGRLVFHVHDLDPAVHFRHRLTRVLELGLAVSDCDQIAAVDAVFVDEVALVPIATALRHVLLLCFPPGP